MVTYESKLNADLDRILDEGNRRSDEDSDVYQSLHKVVKRLNDLQIPYLIADEMAMLAHGLRRYNDDLHILITPAGLREIHQRFDDLGFTAPFKGTRQLCNSETGVRIEFLITGQYPGDGKPKPIAFPDPATAATVIDGICYLKLESLIELKLASGMTNPGRLKDLADVQELIRALKLEESFASKLNPYVREKFIELQKALRSDPPE